MFFSSILLTLYFWKPFRITRNEESHKKTFFFTDVISNLKAKQKRAYVRISRIVGK